MKIDCYSTPDVFDTLAAEWDSCLDPERSDNVFLHLDWQRLWWKHLHRGQLAVVTVRDNDGVLRGIGPWFIEQGGDVKTVLIIGCTDVTDYMDLIAWPGYEEQVLGALLDFMLSPAAPEWDQFDLCNIPEDASTFALLPRLAEARGLVIEAEVQDVCPVIELPDTYEGYLASIDKKQRHELRRKRRRGEAAGAAWYVVGDEHDLDAEIDAFFDLMAMSTSEKAEFLKEPGHRDFFREVGHTFYNAGLLELVFLTIGDQRAATMWQFAYRDRLMLYNSGLNTTDFAALSPGILLSTYSIEDAIQRGYAIYDFLRGDEVYKYRMGATDVRVFNIIVRR